MTKDEIIDMAIEVGCIFPMENEFWGYTCEFSSLGALEDFAKLVADAAAAKEREACAELIAEIGSNKLAGAIRARGES